MGPIILSKMGLPLSGTEEGWARNMHWNDYYNKDNLILTVSSGTTDSGEEAVINRPYESYLDYIKEPFPSGNVKKIYYLKQIFLSFKKNYLTISNSFYLVKNIG